MPREMITKLTAKLRIALPFALLLSALLLLALRSVGPALAQSATAADPNDPSAAPLPTADSGLTDTDIELDNYEASEQISEDLSVSFPVDI